MANIKAFEQYLKGQDKSDNTVPAILGIPKPLSTGIITELIMAWIN